MKKRKKNNAAKRKQRLSVAFTNGLGIARVGENNCDVVDILKLKKYKASQQLIENFTNVAHSWSILICCICDDGRDKYIKSDVINTQARYYQRDLTEVLQAEHQRLANEQNSKHLVNLAWLAVPRADLDFDVESAGILFDRLGAWNVD